MCEILRDSYNVIPLAETDSMADVLAGTKINLIISDVMMPDSDGLRAVRELKESKFNSHIPVILLTAKNHPEDHIQGLEAGADMYITKPFDVDYLKRAIRRLLKREEETKVYYTSALSAFELEEGRMIHRDDKAFYDKVLQVIDAHFTEPGFTAGTLARELSVSPRQLYRRLEMITSDSPGQLILDYKLKVAEGLLIKTTVSVNEIIFLAGFNNRGSFYRLFLNRYGMTPKLFRQKHTPSH